VHLQVIHPLRVSKEKMSHKRLHIRIPVIGQATLSTQEGVVIQAQAIDISMGGLRIAAPAISLWETEYEVSISVAGRGNIKFKAFLVHENEDMAGFKIIDIESQQLHTIYLLVNDFQCTEEFIQHIDESNILDDWLLDDHGCQLDVTFEVAK